MKNVSIKLYLEINNSNLNFLVGENDEENNFKIKFKLKTSLTGIKNDEVFDFQKALNIIKENVYLIEKELNYTFKEIIIILDNFNLSFINFAGYKKLNGSQVSKDNVTYILNSLKSHVNKIETKKKILHIFNSKFDLDKKKIENLPIGLFGDFYSHELSFVLIDSNDYKNLETIFDKCNLKIEKILLRSFVKGAYLSQNNINKETFFHIEINEEDSKIFYFENSSLKYEQKFVFGNNIILKDISKVTSLKIDEVKNILNKMEITNNLSDDELIEKEFFHDDHYRKIRKKLIYEVASARIKEILEIIIFKNINLKHLNENSKIVFFELNSQLNSDNLKVIFENIFLLDKKMELNVSKGLSMENNIMTAYKLVHFGWKKEAIPVTKAKKSLIRRLFEVIFR